MTNKTGFAFGECVKFRTLKDDEAIGYVFGPTNLSQPYDFVDETPVAFEREYCIVHLDENGGIVCDMSVAACWIKPYHGYVPDDVFRIEQYVRDLLNKNVPPSPDQEFDM